jgi:hypothetical protein
VPGAEGVHTVAVRNAHRGRRRSLVGGCVAAALATTALAGCSDDAPDDARDGAADGAADAGEPPEPEAVAPEVQSPADATTVVATNTAVDAAVATSAALYDSAPVVAVAGAGDVGSQARAASVAVGLGVPLLLTPAPSAPSAPTTEKTDTGHTPGRPDADPAPGPAQRASTAVAGELDRLGPQAVLTFGGAATTWAGMWDGDASVVTAPSQPGDVADLTGHDVGGAHTIGANELVGAVAGLDRDSPPLLTVDGESAAGPAPSDAVDAEPSDEAGLPKVAPVDGIDDLLVLVSGTQADVAAAATARASGARMMVVPGGDPRTYPAVIKALSEHPPGKVLALGPGFGSPDQLRARLDVAATGVELPGGGQVVYPGRRMVALYGHPGTVALGVLGEQPIDQAIRRAKELAADYQPLVEEPVVPAFEIIATVASGGAGPDGNYSYEAPVEQIRPWVEAAGTAGVYVVLDIQPGRTDFLTQAQRYEELLAQPHVGLALDPEWRLRPDQVHLRQIGSVGAAEVNSVVTWLADLTRARKLPQKLLLLHQFQLQMIGDRGLVDTSRDELAVLIHADGFGTPGQKIDTWNAMHAAPPPRVWWGWKNFIDEDRPTFSPSETYAITPSPVFVSYQ